MGGGDAYAATSFVASFSVVDGGGAAATNTEGVAISSDGTKLFVSDDRAGTNKDKIYQYTLGTAFDVSTAAFAKELEANQSTNATRGITFNNDGTKLFVVNTNDDRVYQFTLGTAFDLGGATTAGSFSVVAQDNAEDETEKQQLVSEQHEIDLIKRWAGYSQSSATDAEVLDILGLDGSYIPRWYREICGYGIYSGKLEIQDVRVGLEYLIKVGIVH